MKIKYCAFDIILAILGFVIVSVLYYLGNFYGFVAGAVFAMPYAIIMNRRILGKVAKRIRMKGAYLSEMSTLSKRRTMFFL